MIEINIAEDFAKTPGWRTYEDGPFSGQEFYERILRNKFELALSKGEKVKIILDGGNGYTTSFLNEAFRRLGDEFGGDKVWNNLVLISNEIPKYIVRIKEALYEMEKR